MIARIRKAMEESDEGFTLIELLVVIIIIGILAAIAIPIFLNQRKKATEASMKADLHTVADEMETYFVDNQTYPSPGNLTGVATIGADTVKISPSNTVAVKLITNGYCLTATSSNTSTTWYYNSTTGGLTTTAC